MRDILNDLDSGRSTQADPVRAAREAMRSPQPKRFYERVEVVEAEGRFEVHLDGRAARTPGRMPLALPTRAAALLVAEEFDRQGEVMNLPAMAVTRLVNTAIDGVAHDPQAVAEDVLRYSGSDLICYRAASPEALVARQALGWDPLIDWASESVGANLILAEGVMHVEQPRSAIAAVDAWLRTRREPFRLASLHVMTTLLGSAILSLAVEAGRLSAKEAWSLAHIDEDWNLEQWGEDAEAAAARAVRWRDMDAAARLIQTLS